MGKAMVGVTRLDKATVGVTFIYLMDNRSSREEVAWLIRHAGGLFPETVA